MADGIHYLALSRAKERYADTLKEMDVAQKQLDEALKKGDLRESSDYDEAKARVGKLSRELDQLAPVKTMKAVRANDNLKLIQEGSVLELTVHCVTSDPLKPGSPEFEKCKEGAPAFAGILCYGASLPFHELLTDKILGVDTPVGQYLLGKHPGDYSIAVPSGFSNVTVTPLNTGSVEFKDLYCSLGGERV